MNIDRELAPYSPAIVPVPEATLKARARGKEPIAAVKLPTILLWRLSNVILLVIAIGK
jgi:hypothetical protein